MKIARTRRQLILDVVAVVVCAAGLVGVGWLILAADGGTRIFGIGLAPAGGYLFFRTLYRLLDAIAVAADPEGAELEDRDAQRRRDAEVRRAGSDYRPF